MKIGDLVKYKNGTLFSHESFHFPMTDCTGIVTREQGVSYEVHWLEEKVKSWCPQRFLEVVT